MKASTMRTQQIIWEPDIFPYPSLFDYVVRITPRKTCTLQQVHDITLGDILFIQKILVLFGTNHPSQGYFLFLNLQGKRTGNASKDHSNPQQLLLFTRCLYQCQCKNPVEWHWFQSIKYRWHLSLSLLRSKHQGPVVQEVDNVVRSLHCLLHMPDNLSSGNLVKRIIIQYPLFVSLFFSFFITFQLKDELVLFAEIPFFIIARSERFVITLFSLCSI